MALPLEQTENSPIQGPFVSKMYEFCQKVFRRFFMYNLNLIINFQMFELLFQPIMQFLYHLNKRKLKPHIGNICIKYLTILFRSF